MDPRTDIFSFGLVLYELATGKRAFGGDTWPVLQEAVLKEVPTAARGVNQAIPTKLENIISRSIEKDRNTRFQSAAEMRVALETLHRQLAPKHLPRAWGIGLGVSGALVLGAIMFLLNRPPKTISVTPEIRLRQLTTNSSENPVIGGAISPDGKYLAYNDSSGLHLKVIDTGETRVVPQPADLKNRSVRWEVGGWFPDSTRFLVACHPSTEEFSEWNSDTTSIWSVSAPAGTPTRLRDHAVLGSVSPDGSTVTFATNKGKRGERELWLMGPNGEQARKFYEVNDDVGVGGLGWSPDGKRYGYILTNSSGDSILSRDLNWGAPITIFDPSQLKGIDDLVWLHHGRVVYSLHETEHTNVCNYWTMRLDFATGKRIEEPRRLTNWPSSCVYGGSATQDDKKITYTASSSFYTSYIADLKAGGTRVSNINHFTLEDSDDVIMDWTADDKSVIVAQNRRDHYSLYSSVSIPILRNRSCPPWPGA